LFQLATALLQYNNVIAGTGNTIAGTKNFVFGNYDTINGSNNWVFISQFTGNVSGDLIIGQWMIQLNKTNLILISPRLAISFLS
jgi:hypothetical protein